MHSTSHMGCTRPHELYRVAFVKRDALPHRRRHPFPGTWSQRDSVRSGSQEDLKGAAKVCWAHPTVPCRYYLNTFQDGRKQDSVDLATGAFEVPKPKGEG